MKTVRIKPSNAHHRAEALKERVYVTFTALSVVLAMQSHSADHLTASEALKTLAITVIGTVLAVFVADLISHLAVHAKTPSNAELARMAHVSFGAFGAVVVPLLFLAAAAFGGWSVEVALRASTTALIAALVLIGYLAVRRVKMRWWQRLIVLGAEFALALAVLGLEVLAHG